jgi:hypothetical protein
VLLNGLWLQLLIDPSIIVFMEASTGEPNFKDWVAEEAGMHERRRHIMIRAGQFGAEGWPFADDMAGTDDPGTRKNGLIALVTLVGQGHLAVDMDNPRLLHITETGNDWLEHQTAYDHTG